MNTGFERLVNYMKKIILTNTDLNISNICLGGGNFGTKLDKEHAFSVMDSYVAGGGNFIDTANVYCRWIPGNANCSEEFIGSWLKSRNAYNKIIIGTKGAHYDFNAPDISRVTKEDIRKDLEESLNTLGIDKVDLYWLHRDDKSKDIEEIIDWMEEFVSEGKIRYYGASNFSKERLENANQYVKRKNLQGFSAISNQWSAASLNHGNNLNQDPTMVFMDKDFYEWHKSTRTPIIPYTSTAYGFFEKLHSLNPVVKEGKLVNTEVLDSFDHQLLKAYFNQRNLEMYEDFLKIHNETKKSLFSISVAFLLNQPFNTVPVISVSKIEQLNGIREASEIRLSNDIIQKYQP